MLLLLTIKFQVLNINYLLKPCDFIYIFTICGSIRRCGERNTPQCVAPNSGKTGVSDAYFLEGRSESMRKRQLDRHIRVDNNDTPLSDDTSVRTGFTGQINIALHKEIDSVRKNPFPEGIDIGDFQGAFLKRIGPFPGITFGRRGVGP